MGILNVTPDSFSDGGRHFDPATAIAAGRKMIRDGAAIVDIGGESTRPGATPIPPAEEQSRILPVIAALRDAGAALSVDSRNAATMAAALDAGATIVNDVSGLAHDPAAAAVVAERGCPVILMHMRGTPATMNSLAHYGDVCAEVAAELAARIAAAEAAGISRTAIAIDPGFGFAKDAGHNAALLRGLPTLAAFGLPIVAGLSRKRFVGSLAQVADPAELDAASIAAGLFAVSNGAAMLRVHDVAGTVRALRIWQALAG
jgi:dihydropteroate synthase